MLLHRLALMRFQQKIPTGATWGYTTDDGVNVRIDQISGALDNEPRSGDASFTFLPPARNPSVRGTELLLHAELSTDYVTPTKDQLILPDEPRIRAERALSEMAATLAILAETRWQIVSPRPYLAVSAETSEEDGVVRSLARIVLPKSGLRPPYHGRGLAHPIDIANALPDRREGIQLLGSALAATNGLAKLHELFRLFESAFARANAKLVRPLASFLASYPEWDLGYSESEVEFWVNELRHPATHADRQIAHQVIYDSDVRDYLERIEQAAYDVLFNKDTWGDCGQARNLRWPFASARVADGKSICAPGAIFRTESPYDHFSTFLLDEQVNVIKNDALFMADWYLPDGEHERLDGELRAAGVSW